MGGTLGSDYVVSHLDSFLSEVRSPRRVLVEKWPDLTSLLSIRIAAVHLTGGVEGAKDLKEESQLGRVRKFHAKLCLCSCV